MLLIMELTASKLRANIYKVLDEVIATGRPAVIRRKNRTLKITASEVPSKLERLKRQKKRNIIIGDPEELVHCDWSHEWRSNVS